MKRLLYEYLCVISCVKPQEWRLLIIMMKSNPKGQTIREMMEQLAADNP